MNKGFLIKIILAYLEIASINQFWVFKHGIWDAIG